ncbi:hypothetical protein RJ639_020827 [Escallonia herrerae]|uniref:Uncharacterized protein n=1 Tax=Escallonia herrerae TaxID=1293975 RepID=A0AA88V5S4_9ASTE|nr:hypothetical protein RJ639_020827 [Escallonia herrerae]
MSSRGPLTHDDLLDATGTVVDGINQQYREKEELPCLRLKNVPDETVVVNSPREDVLKLIRSINSNMFIQGILSGTYNASFFVT